ncbi:hypothetical protein DPMN_134011 [Dreissena polymorpha]|uniref:Uncharacterized protein n=1 Tax=Dreissena polymorpha TaxID=45954 RepID=A0A9D4FUT6_DREPO|nr:hypothetical protein DPMN_134011 [Dreissena polymorpha]
MLSAVSFVLLLTLCASVSGQTYSGYPSCYKVYCPPIYCPNGQYTPIGECCPRCNPGYGYPDPYFPG